jgi:5-methylcytosine-specific restriction endonuclease McrA
LVYNFHEPSIPSFNDFKIDDEIIHIYTRQYLQYYYDERINDTPLEVREIHSKIQEIKNSLAYDEYLSAYKSHSLNKLLSISKYQSLLAASECYYCELTKEDFITLFDKEMIGNKANRGFNLEIDRKEPNLEYTDENCVAACYWCNNAKTDEFNDEEFKPIGLAIGTALRARIV